MKKRFLIFSILGLSILFTGCSGNQTTQETNNEVTQNIQQNTQFDSLFNSNLDNFIKDDLAKETKEDTIEENSSSEGNVKTEENNNIKDDISGSEINELEMKFIGCKKDTFIVEEVDIRKAEDEIEPYDVFVMSFYYDERPRLGFISPSGKTYYTECLEEIDAENGKFGIYVADAWCTIALPGEVGEWTLYCDKKSNEVIEYNIQEIIIEEIEEPNVDNNDTQNTDISLTNFSQGDINDYESLGHFVRIFQLFFPDGMEFSNEMHNFVNNEIADTINSVQGIKYSGYQLDDGSFTILVSVDFGSSTDEVTKIADIAATKAVNLWKTKYSN